VFVPALTMASIWAARVTGSAPTLQAGRGELPRIAGGYTNHLDYRHSAAVFEEAFIKAWQSIHRFDGRMFFLYLVAQNHVLFTILQR
jgi:hypothetical protein